MGKHEWRRGEGIEPAENIEIYNGVVWDIRDAAHPSSISDDGAMKGQSGSHSFLFGGPNLHGAPPTYITLM